MTDPRRMIKIALLALGLLNLIGFCLAKTGETMGISGLLYPNGTPVGADFINLWSAAELTLSGRISEIYQSAQFMAYEQTLTGAPIGLRLWAYPPHSLLLAWPFGLVGYFPALALWSGLGLVVLWAGARRLGFDRLEIAILLLSPASILNIYYGQTGNLATGLLLLALSARNGRDLPPVIAAALLTIKPQAGFLLPVIWLFQRRWQAIAWTAALTVLLVAIAALLFRISPWRDYLGDTLPTLSLLERAGSGPFISMIPSAFMALRIVTGNGDLALWLHAGFAVLVGIVLLIRLRRVEDPLRRAGLVLLATALMTPYLHNYDLTLLLAGALIVARRWPARDAASLGANVLVMLAWALPSLVVVFNLAGIPISPLLILPLLFLA